MKTLFTIITVFLGVFCHAQCNNQLDNYAIGFYSIKASSFTFLDNQLDEVKIVGYGEDTHGTAEFTTLAQELMLYLSTQHNFKILILETGFGEGLYLNDYIQGRRDDLKTIMNDYNSTWRYRTKVFYQLMNILRRYNENNTDKIFIYGCEMQYIASDIKRIQEYLKTVDPDYEMDGFQKVNLWQSFTEDEKSDYFIAYTKLKKHFTENHELFKSKSSKKAFNIVYHIIEVLGQFVTTINQNVAQRKSDFRDLYMAENIDWILRFHGSEAKAMYWAHNAHVGDWVNNGNVDVTGHHLRRFYANAYFNIATDFGSGSFIAYPSDAHKTGNWLFQTYTIEKVLEKTFTACLQNLGKPNTFLNIRAAKEHEVLSQFFNTYLTTMSGAGAQVRKTRTETQDLGKAFDAIIYIDKTNKINWAE